MIIAREAISGTLLLLFLQIFFCAPAKAKPSSRGSTRVNANKAKKITIRLRQALFQFLSHLFAQIRAYSRLKAFAFLYPDAPMPRSLFSSHSSENSRLISRILL
jgi:hypothetical protein